KRKNNSADSPSAIKRARRAVETPKKDKQRASEPSTAFHSIKATLTLSIPPIFALDPRRGALEMLDSMIMRYIPAFEGVVLSHSHLRFEGQPPTGVIRGSCPFLVCDVSFTATVWRPQIGMSLVGKVNVCYPDHISLLLHRTFNVSIPKRHIPADQWQFEYGPAENDPEFGAGADEEDLAVHSNDSGGKWVHHLTGDTIGDASGYLRFTVIGLIVANEMLSLVGSIQPDPFAPAHAESYRKDTSTDDDDEEAEEEATDSSSSESDESTEDGSGENEDEEEAQ
ncbi:hypothetical protein FISHEDRAFT_31308, partial [Fistulina hepatica ATCC 64428]